MNKHYTYIYYHPVTLVPFYVGMGKGRRLYDHLNTAKRLPTPTQGDHKLNTIRAILQEGLEPIIQKIDEDISREQAAELEELLIEIIGRRDLGTGPLTNRTQGGDGMRGWSEEQKQEYRDRNERLGLKPPNMKGRRYTKRDEYKTTTCVIVATGVVTKAHRDDPRWASGEIVGINAGTTHTIERRRNHSATISKLKWWNNGITNIRREVSPGPEWVAGRGFIKRLDK